MDSKIFENSTAQKSYELAHSKGYILRPLNEDDFHLLSKIDTIFQDDPVAYGILEKGELQKMLEKPWKQILEDGLAVGLFNGDEMVAVSFSHDLCTEYSLENLGDSLLVILEFLDMIDQPYKHQKEFKRGQTMYCFLLGVAKDFRGNGYSHLVLSESVRLAKIKGYKDLYMQATNPITYNIVQKLFSEYKVTSAHDCQNFTNQKGQRPFSHKSVITRGIWVNISY